MRLEERKVLVDAILANLYAALHEISPDTTFALEVNAPIPVSKLREMAEVALTTVEEHRVIEP